jgi:hypothetical protein
MKDLRRNRGGRRILFRGWLRALDGF